MRIYSLYALDERLARLRRRDISITRERWIGGALTSESISKVVDVHLEERDRLDEETKERIANEIANVLTLPEEHQRIDALIKILRTERFWSLIDEFSAQASACAKVQG